MKRFYVEIVRVADGHVESRMGPMSGSKADRVERGALINLNRDEYVVRIRAARRRKP